jgi:hypothetical protein
MEQTYLLINLKDETKKIFEGNINLMMHIIYIKTSYPECIAEKIVKNGERKWNNNYIKINGSDGNQIGELYNIDIRMDNFHNSGSSGHKELNRIVKFFNTDYILMFNDEERRMINEEYLEMVINSIKESNPGLTVEIENLGNDWSTYFIIINNSEGNKIGELYVINRGIDGGIADKEEIGRILEKFRSRGGGRKIHKSNKSKIKKSYKKKNKFKRNRTGKTKRK